MALVGPPSIVTPGACGSRVRIWVAVPVLPDGSVTDATTVWGPAARVSALRAHTPALACPVNVCEPMVTVTRGVPGSSVVPEIDGSRVVGGPRRPTGDGHHRCGQVVDGLGDRAVGERHGARGEDAALERGTVPEGDHAGAEDGPDPLDVGAERDRADDLPVDVVGERAVRQDDLGGGRGAERGPDLEDEACARVAGGVQGDRARVRDGRGSRVEARGEGLAGQVTSRRRCRPPERPRRRTPSGGPPARSRLRGCRRGSCRSPCRVGIPRACP